MNILIINQFADNKGDRAVLAVILEQLTENAAIKQVTIATSRVAAWSASDFEHFDLDVRLVPWGWNRYEGNQLLQHVKQRLMRSIAYPLARYSLNKTNSGSLVSKILSCFCNSSYLKAVKASDLVISTGGHHFTNWFSREGVSPLFFDLAIAEIFGKRIVLWSQTIGELQFSNPANARFINRLMQKADSIYIRDEGSVAELEQAGVEMSRIHETEETVFGADAGSWTPPSQRQPVVGISVYTGSLRDAEAHETYTAAMSGLLDHVTARGYRVLFLPMQLKGQKGDDRGVIQRIIAMSRQAGQVEMLEADIPTRDHLQQVRGCRLFIGHKTHSIIFSLVTGTPVLAISYHQKTNDFMAQYQLSDHCVNEPELSADLLCSLFDRIESNLDETGKTEMHHAEIQRARMAEDFRSMLSG